MSFILIRFAKVLDLMKNLLNKLAPIKKGGHPKLATSLAIKVVPAVCLFLTILLTNSVAQPIKSPYQVVPELYPNKVVRVAFHFIHKYSTTDSTNIPDNRLGKTWWNKRVDSINYYLAHPVTPNYPHHKSFANDIKFRIENVGVYHHVDSNYWEGAGIHQFYNRFVIENPNFSTFEKDSVLHSFYYGDDIWGGMSSGIPSRVGMRFKGRYKEFSIWTNWSPMEHYRSDYNYIHELLHCFGLRHNFKNSSEGTECSGCDAEIANHCFDMAQKPYAANNYMSKGQNAKPGGHSVTNCQLQRILYYGWGLYPRILGTKKDVSMLTYPVDKNYNAIISDSVILDYDFKAFGNIKINAHSTFILRSELQLPPGAKIHVKKGATLIIDGGTLVTREPEGVTLSKGNAWHFWKPKYKRTKGGKVLIENGGKIESVIN
ncbi:MAG: hypothetical protein CL840_06145 [Crocinitomicaceae bacterium]|nr:hypothetical protein [Crocinitomicaceae bacterium]